MFWALITYLKKKKSFCDFAFWYAWLLIKCEKLKEKSTITIIKKSKTIWFLFFTLPVFDC